MNKIWDVNAHARVVGYGRVSTDSQLKNYSPEIQLEWYERDKKRYEWVDMQIVFESGTGTSIKERPAFQEVLRMVQSGEVDAVWIIDADRLARPDDLRLWAEIHDIFIESDTKVVTPTRIYDLTVDNDLFSFEVEGVFAKHNRRRLLQNMNRGKIQKAKNGRNAGGSAPDGYIVTSKIGKYLINSDRVGYATLAWDLVYNHDFTLRQLVKEYDKRGIRSARGGKWSLTHFHDMFYNEEYLGKYIYGKTKFIKDRKTGRVSRIKTPPSEWIVVENAHEPIVTPEVFYGVQEKLKWRRKRINHNTHMLTGIATCYLCGDPVHVKFSGEKRKPKYVCVNKEKGCTSRWLDFYDLNDRVWDKFKVILENPALIEKLATPLQNVEYRLKELRNRQSRIQEDIGKVEAKKQKLLDLYLDGSYSKPDLDQKSEELRKNVVAYRSEYGLITAGIKALEEQPDDFTEIVKYMRILSHSDTKLTYDQKVRIFRQFVYKVKLTEKLEFEMELYKTPIGDMPEKFRSFPKDLSPEVAVKGTVTDSLGHVLSPDNVTPSQVTYSSAHLDNPNIDSLHFPTIKIRSEDLVNV